MASLTNEKNGRRTIQFVEENGKRKSIRLGKVTRKNAESVKTRVEYLISSKITGNPLDQETSKWLSQIDDGLRRKLQKVGLVTGPESTLLEPFLDSYFGSRTDWKPSTRIAYGQSKKKLIEYFGPKKPLREITRGDADQWKLFLFNQGLSSNTIRKRSCQAKHFFETARCRGLIEENVFSHLDSIVRANPDRMYFVTRDESDAVLKACPDDEWRLLFALGRFGGLRCPSETLQLKWQHVDWDRSRLTVPSPKTEHLPGGRSRVIPMFPELQPYLLAVYNQAEPVTEYVITRYRGGNTNLRTQLQKIIRRAGIAPWPKLWQNLRSSRQTELVEFFPEHVVCAWIGNSRAVAAKHYLQVTDAHFENATRTDGCSALHNPVQQAAESARTAMQRKNDAARKINGRREIRRNANWCEIINSQKVGDKGLEPPTSRV